MKHRNGLETKARTYWQKIMRAQPLLAFDFDGTLAPIVHLPNGAFPRNATLALLSELEKHCAIAVVTGRSIKNLKEQLRLSNKAPAQFRPQYFIGNHGMEMPWDSQSLKLQQRARIWTHVWRAEIKKQLSAFPEVTWIEFKGVSLTLHIRRGRRNQASTALKNWLRTTLTCDPQKLKQTYRIAAGRTLPQVRLRMLDGKNVLNVMPLDEKFPRLDKGVALHLLMKSIKKPIAIYAGDDTTDEDVFMARPLKGQRVIGLRVGRHSDSKAPFYLKTQDEMDDFLRMLIELAPTPSPVKPKSRRPRGLRSADR